MKTLTVKQKLIGMTLILSALVAGLSFFFINRFGTMGATYKRIVDNRFPQYAVAGAMDYALLNLRTNMNELVGVQRNLDNFGGFSQRAREKFETFKTLQSAMISGHRDIGKEVAGLEGILIPPCREGGAIEARTRKAIQLFSEFRSLCQGIIMKKKETLEIVNEVGWYDSKENCRGAVKLIVETARAIEDRIKDRETRFLLSEMRRQEKNLLQRADSRYISRLKEAYADFNAATGGDINRLGKTYFTAFESIWDKLIRLKKLEGELKRLVRQDLRKQQKGLVQAVEALKARALEQMVTYSRAAVAMEATAGRLILIISIVVVLLSLGAGWLISTGINRVLTRIIASLGSGADQVAAASGQVSAASQSLAAGSSEQAASIEETSASIEEMASMTRQNADHAGQADQLMKDANAIVTQANGAMADLTTSMASISQASVETSKIIKTIDEIAFQTNLLALNAAVEAARAGEAGAGFAVVADEVRNLAMRAAKAARDTSALIEGTVQRIENGSSTLSRTGEIFGSVDDSASKVGVLVAEIATASQEQAQGIDQINTAVAEMDKVIQQNAANAEESASASEELNAQAEQMNSIMGELRALVGIKEGAARVAPGHAAGNKATPSISPEQASDFRKISSGRFEAQGRKSDPKQLLPLEEVEFADF